MTSTEEEKADEREEAREAERFRKRKFRRGRKRLATNSGIRQAIWLIAILGAVMAPVVVGPPWGFTVGFALLMVAFVAAPRLK